MIRLFSPTIDNKEIKAVTQTLKSLKWASGAGKDKVYTFEKDFRKYIGSKECVAVNSGTAALHLALNSLEIKNREVLVPSFTFVSTVHSILYNNGIPIFVDIDPNTLCLSIEDLKKKISRKTRAIIPMHFGGFPCNMKEIWNIAKKSQSYIVEDAAHACGTKFEGKKIGVKSDMVCFSFHPIKNLAMPKGGAISLNLKNSTELKQKLNVLRWCGIDERKKTSYNISALGYNYYMDEISAAIGIIQLKKLEKMNRIRSKIARQYNEGLEYSQKMPLSTDASYHLYWICVKNRDTFVRKMEQNGIETGFHYPSVHKTKFYNSKIDLPITEKISKEIVTLPMHPNLTEKQINHVIKTANSLQNS